MAGHWVRFGRELRFHRERAGLSQKYVAQQLHVAAPTVSAYETGRRAPPRDVAAHIDDTIQAGGALTQIWDELHDQRDIPQDWREFDVVERQATEIREYTLSVVPGILQTVDYAQSLLISSGVWNAEQALRLAKLRSERISNVESATLMFVSDHDALARIVGSRSVQRAQLEHLLSLIDAAHITVHMVPWDCPEHPGLTGSFRIMTLSNGRLVGHEDYLSGVNVVTGNRINQLNSRFARLLGEAMPPRLSRNEIERIYNGL